MDYKNTIQSLKSEKFVIVALCAIGAVRIFLFNAGFSFFSNIDEPQHFDLVYRYSHGDIPRAEIEDFSFETLQSMLLYGSREYITIPQPGSAPLPREVIARIQKLPQFANRVSKVGEQLKNHETGSFPFYYGIAGLWYNAGRIMGMEGMKLLYWVRFLNVPVFILLILVSYLTAKSFCAKDYDLRIALPFMVTFFPQDIFYSITPDSFSVLFFSISFFMLVQIYHHDKSYLYHLLTGLVIAATFLIKISNVVVFALGALVVLLKLIKSYSEKHLRWHLLRLFVLAITTIIPVAIWLIRNYCVLGDSVGTLGKAEYLGWTVKPMNQMLHHPIFTIDGAVFFISELTKTLWRGEFTWHCKPMANRYMDIFYVVSTAVLVLISFTMFLVKRKNRFEIGVSFFVVTVSVLFLAAISLLYDFGDCAYPSRDKPYFTSARLISGMLIPFLVIYLDGLTKLLSFLKSRKYLLLAVCVIIVAVTWSEISISLDAFKSQYNWFHIK